MRSIWHPAAIMIALRHGKLEGQGTAMFKPAATAIEDLATAFMLYQKAV